MKIQRWLIAIALFLTAVVVIGFWVYLETDELVAERLASREFLAPTTFWASPIAIEKGESWSPSEIENLFEVRRYSRITNLDETRIGTYLTHSCGESPAEAGDFQCWTYRLNETSHPVLSGFDLQSVALDSANQVQRTWRLNRESKVWEDVASVQMEPRRLAQYVEGKPLLQDWIPLGEIPPTCLNAVLAIEDPKFLEHNGINWKGLARAAVVNATKGRYAQGGSTVTQQMVKNFFLNSDKTLSRKLREFAMSLVLESQLNKDQIFEIYLNIIYLGQAGPFSIFGYSAASQYYFQKKIQDLNLSECSLLAAILNSPGNYDPFRKSENALKRRTLVLSKMRELEMIGESELQEAQNAGLPKNTRARVDETAPYFLEAVHREVQESQFAMEGLHVYTTMDARFQENAQKDLIQHLQNLETGSKTLQKLKEQGLGLEGVVLTVDVETGRITSAIGGRGFRKSPFNRILDGHRQVGSLAKPFVYLTAFEENKELNPASLILDQKETYKIHRQSWTPENYTKKFYGEVSLNYALKNSLNAATVKLGMDLDLDSIIDNLRRAGVESQMEKVPSIMLGSMDARPIEMAEAYLTLARMGRHIKPRFYDYLVFANGNVQSNVETDSEQVFTPEATAMVVSILEDATRAGTSQMIKRSGFNWPAAGKTGTTSDYRDAWFVGFTPKDLALIWVGFDQSQNHGLTGGSGAVPLWINVMKEVSKHRAISDFVWPENTEIRSQRIPPEETDSNILLRR